jgi:hypothetical protein
MLILDIMAVDITEADTMAAAIIGETGYVLMISIHINSLLTLSILSKSITSLPQITLI